MRTIVIGTRESQLAVIQSKWIINELEKQDVPFNFELKYISTKGDRNQNVALSKVGGTGIFIQDIEEALFEKEIDFAVHSMKDLPAQIPEAFKIGAIPVREDHRDAFIGRGKTLDELSQDAVIGTSSARRAAQLKAAYPHLQTKWIRGPVDARIKQLEEGKYDGIILAVAGLKRLGLTDVITQYLPAEKFTPAAGQGALAIECRSDDEEILQLLRKMNDSDVETAVWTERTFVNLLDQEDKAPIGAYAFVKNGEIILYTSVSSVDGEHILTYNSRGTSIQQVATEAANHLIGEGAEEIIKAAKLEIDKE
ncbi:MAG TPA: hydroxymethylbilane synthase [Pseudogracilibacillus sp.]|nr:hydroxymethylbilane synthase [Pseudogracilibacillus sp.]